MSMVARALERKEGCTEDRSSAPQPQVRHSGTSKHDTPITSPTLGPVDPMKDPAEWPGISASLLHEYGEAKASPVHVRAADLNKPAVIEMLTKAGADARFSRDGALSRGQTDALSAPSELETERQTSSAVVDNHLESRFSLEREARVKAEANVSALQSELSALRTREREQSVAAARAQAALEAREELVAFLKDEIAELRAMFKTVSEEKHGNGVAR